MHPCILLKSVSHSGPRARDSARPIDAGLQRNSSVSFGRMMFSRDQLVYVLNRNLQFDVLEVALEAPSRRRVELKSSLELLRFVP